MISRRVILSLIICLISFGRGEVFAHPLDISSTTLTIHGDRAAGITYFHPFEWEYLLKQAKVKFQTVEDFFQNQDIFSRYIWDHLHISTEGKTCQIGTIEMPPREAYEVMTSGILFEYSVLCSSTIHTIHFDITFFTGFALQTNRLHLLDDTGNEVFYKVGTPNITQISYDPQETNTMVDTDGDGLADQDELASNTDPKNPDTDGDFYTDYEEVTFGWDPRSKNISPGQSPRYEYPKTTLRPGNSIAQVESSIWEKSTKNDTPPSYDLSQWVPGEWFFRVLMRRVSDAAKKQDIGGIMFIILFSLTVALGFLHALGPGHAKTLLASILVDTHTTRRQGILFAIVFSLTHIIDIILLFALMQLFSYFSDPTQVISMIQKVSPYVLILLGSWLLFRAIRPDRDISPVSVYEKKHIWILGIIAGLAPCSFGWSLFFLLFSIGKVAWIPFLIFWVGLGIFLCLLVMIFLMEYIRVRSYSRFHRFSRYSSIISASIIIVIGCILTFLSLV